MKSDVIYISNNGEHMEEALALPDKVAVYKELKHKDALHLRLLTEELLGMMRSITGERMGCFWIEDHDKLFRLHLQVDTPMDFDKEEKLLAASTSGKNEAAKGIMGRIRTFFDPIDWGNAPYSMSVSSPMNTNTIDPGFTWSMNSYRDAVKEDMENHEEGAAEAWDELEKSVVSNIADDVKVSIRGRKVEMVIELRVS